MSWKVFSEGLPTIWICRTPSGHGIDALVECVTDIRGCIAQGAIMRREPVLQEESVFELDERYDMVRGRVAWPAHVNRVKSRGLIFRRRHVPLKEILAQAGL